MRGSMNLGPVLQYESHPTVRVNDLLRRPAIRREAHVHCLSILWRTPLPAFSFGMPWLSELCGDVDRRSQFADPPGRDRVPRTVETRRSNIGGTSLQVFLRL